MAAEGGVTSLPSSTDPGFCSLLTGRVPQDHGVRTTAWRYAALPRWAGSPTPTVPTIFEMLARAGLRTAAFMGDDRGLLCTSAASLRWPPADAIPPGTPVDAHGYPRNAAVLAYLVPGAADLSFPFVFGHLNEADTAGHDSAPESKAAVESYRQTDSQVGQVLDALNPSWAETVVIIVSDHDMEARTVTPPIDLSSQPGFDEIADGVIPDGGSALVHVRPGVSHQDAARLITQVDGVDYWETGGPELLIAGAKPGRIFAAPWHPAGGFHGGPSTARTVTIVGGGHPRVAALAAWVRARRPHLADWAGLVLDLLQVRRPEQVGADQPRGVV